MASYPNTDINQGQAGSKPKNFKWLAAVLLVIVVTAVALYIKPNSSKTNQLQVVIGPSNTTVCNKNCSSAGGVNNSYISKSQAQAILGTNCTYSSVTAGPGSLALKYSLVNGTTGFYKFLIGNVTEGWEAQCTSNSSSLVEVVYQSPKPRFLYTGALNYPYALYSTKNATSGNLTYSYYGDSYYGDISFIGWKNSEFIYLTVGVGNKSMTQYAIANIINRDSQ